MSDASNLALLAPPPPAIELEVPMLSMWPECSALSTPQTLPKESTPCHAPSNVPSLMLRMQTRLKNVARSNRKKAAPKSVHRLSEHPTGPGRIPEQAQVAAAKIHEGGREMSVPPPPPKKSIWEKKGEGEAFYKYVVVTFKNVYTYIYIYIYLTIG